MDKLRVGFDLDGVIAQPLFDGFLVKARIVKEHLLKFLGRTGDYFYPRSRLERQAWRILNRRRKPSTSREFLLKCKKELAANFYLISSRYKFLERETEVWLKSNGLDDVFDQVILNSDDKNPNEFKKTILEREGVNFFIDDDLEVLESLRGRVKTHLSHLSGKKKVNQPFPTFSSLESYLESLLEEGRR